MKDWTGFWESGTHELKQISEETGVPVDKFQDIYEAMYPNIHKWAWYIQTIIDLEELKESKPTAYDIAHGLKTAKDLERYEDLPAEIDNLKAELDALCHNDLVLPVETPKWLIDVLGVSSLSRPILPVLEKFNKYLIGEIKYAPIYVNRLILAFEAYLEYQGIQYRPYLDLAHACHHWLPPKECEYKAKV